MAKRYVFWREADGRPYTRDDDRRSPNELLAEIGSKSSVTAGNVSWPLFTSRWYQAVVHSSAVVLDPKGNELNAIDASSIIQQAIVGVANAKGGSKPIQPNEVLAAADRIAAVHFRKPLEKYALITSLSIKNLPSKQIRIQDCRVSSVVDRTKYADPDALRNQREDNWLVKHVKSTRYLTVKVETWGRTVHEATQTALDSLNFLRGLWTLVGTFRSWSINFGSSQQKPIGVVHLGPVHTLHNSDRSPATTVFWYDPSYTQDRALFDPTDKWDKIESNRRWAVGKVRRLPHGKDVERLVIRYAAALDNSDLDVCFLQIWSILEKLTDTVGGRYEETIERATWIDKDRARAKELMEILRLRRNQYVHAATTGQDSDQIAYLAKSFVDAHLIHLIRNDFKVSSLKEYGEFLSQPTDLDTLKKRRGRMLRAIRFRKR